MQVLAMTSRSFRKHRPNKLEGLLELQSILPGSSSQTHGVGVKVGMQE